jgi:hypothetical protein
VAKFFAFSSLLWYASWVIDFMRERHCCCAAIDPSFVCFLPLNGEDFIPLNGEDFVPLNGEDFVPLNGEDFVPWNGEERS